MSEKNSEKGASLPQTIREWGQVALIGCAIGGGAVTFSTKAWGWFNSGPVALTKAERLEKRTRRLERQSRFMIRGMEKLTREKYDWRAEEKEVARPEDDE